MKARIQRLLAALPPVVHREDLATHPDVAGYQTFGEPELLSLPTPDLVSTTNPRWVFDNLALWKASWPRPFVCVLARARLIGPLFLGITAAREVVLETTRTAGPGDLLWPKVTKKTLWNYLTMPPYRDSRLGERLWAPLFHASQDSYFHWLCDVLPIVEAVRVIEAATGEHVRFIVSRPLRGWQLDTLALVGVGADDVVCWNGQAVCVSRLVVASVRTDGWTCLPSMLALRWIRDQATQRASADEPSVPLVYIRRVGRRRVANDDDVSRMMESRGIRVVELEHMTASEQVRLFRHVRLVVAAHGAGLTNLIFSERAAVIELFGSWKSLCYAAIARGFGHRYIGLDMVPSARFQDVAANRASDFAVDVDRLARAVDERLDRLDDGC